MRPLPPTSTLFPYTTLFRSLDHHVRRGERDLGRPGRLDGEEAEIGRARDHRVERLPGRVEADEREREPEPVGGRGRDRKSTRLNSSHANISYAVFCLKKKKK